MQLKERIGRRLSLRDLHILLTVAERGSLANAARDLAISQPVVSKAIAELERAVGARLLDRGRHGAEPTPVGRALIKRSLIAFDELREGMREIDCLNDPTMGEVRIGAPAAMAAGLLPELIGRAHIRHPGLTVHVTQMPTSSATYECLRRQKVDFLVGRLLSGSLDSDLDMKILFEGPAFCRRGGAESLGEAAQSRSV